MMKRRISVNDTGLYSIYSATSFPEFLLFGSLPDQRREVIAKKQVNNNENLFSDDR